MNRILIAITLLTSVIFAQATYVGSGSCKMCHNKDEKGAQYSIWETSTHAKAFETLKSGEAAAIVSEKGIKTDAWKSPECLVCHTTGFDNGGYEVMDEAFWSPNPDDRTAKKAVKRMSGLQSVGCEACHGAGSDYKSSKTMKAIYSGEIGRSTVGLISPSEETCKSCHNDKSPTFKSFDFDEFYEKIAHPIP